MMNIVIFLAVAPSSAQQARVGTPTFSWQQSYPIPYQSDPAILPLGGTELRALVGFNGQLYAGNGYWMDSDRHDSALPGAQVAVLDSPEGTWRVDLQTKGTCEQSNCGSGLRLYQAISVLDAVTLTTDEAGDALKAPVNFLLAGVWKRGTGLDIFSRTDRACTGSSCWLETEIYPSGDPQIRSFGEHKDSRTGVDMVFAGAANVIFSGAYAGTNKKSSQAIDWGSKPEWQGPYSAHVRYAGARISSFANCNAKLYAAQYNTIYERQDGKSPTWKPIFQTIIYDPGTRITGTRGLTCTTGTNGTDQILLVALEDNVSRIYSIDLTTNYSVVEELNISSLLTKALGTTVRYNIPAYNDMAVYPDLTRGSCPHLLIGLHPLTPGLSQTYNKRAIVAYYLVRDCHGAYTLATIPDAQSRPTPGLESVRTLVSSPFAADPAGTVYAGGFDTGGYSSWTVDGVSGVVHNTAWAYRGLPITSGAVGGAKGQN